MAGGGVAFNEALQNESMGNTNSSEPVVKYGTGGRITGFAEGGKLGSDGIRRFAMAGAVGGDDNGVIANDLGGFDFGNDFGPGDNPFSYTGGTDDVPEIIITGDRPAPTDIDWGDDLIDTGDILITDWQTEGSTGEIPEIIITTNREKATDIDWGTNLISTQNILITDWETETESEFISEMIITEKRPKVTETEIVTDTFSFTPWTEPPWTDPTDTSTETETITETETETETRTGEPPTEPPTPEPPTEPPTEEPPTEEPPTEEPPTEPPTWWTDPPTFTPRRTPPPTTTPVVTTTTPPPTSTPIPSTGRYRPQYQNYANPLTMFNVSNYGQDVPTSAGYNYAASHQGIAALNQNLRDMAAKQMAQTYADGSPKGADMNAVLREMRAVGLTPTDLENAYYGRTTGLNTPFSVYGKNPPIQMPFSFTDVQQSGQLQAPQTPEQKRQAMTNGIFDLIKKLPK